jgi:hypothetical protein
MKPHWLMATMPSLIVSAAADEFVAPAKKWSASKSPPAACRTPVCSKPCARCHVTNSCPRTCAPAPTKIVRCPLATVRPSRSLTIVAVMTELLAPRPSDRVLEVGTGSGYQAAVLARLVAEVYSIEIVAPLAERAKADLARLGVQNVHIRAGDGYAGWSGPSAVRRHHRHLRTRPRARDADCSTPRRRTHGHPGRRNRRADTLLAGKTFRPDGAARSHVRRLRADDGRSHPLRHANARRSGRSPREAYSK